MMNSLKGHLLVATPQLLDPNFVRTVLLMFEHNEAGAAGVILNRPTEATISDISAQFLEERVEWDKPIHLGGPVPGPLLALHTSEALSDQEVLTGVYSTVEAGRIRELIRNRAEPSRIIANYAGWGPGQLEAEIADQSWYSLPAKAEHVFWSSDDDLWEFVSREIRSRRMSQWLGLRELPDDPSMN